MDMKKIMVHFSRIITALVFVFSGFVKAVDPLGTSYKLEDYFTAFNISWANEFALILSITLCTIELVLGLLLLFNLRMKQTAWVLLLMMVFFTGLTLYDAIFSPVADCGCFGDAIILTNWQTFFKNVVLMVFVFVIFYERKNFKSVFKPHLQTSIIVLITLGVFLFTVFNYTHLPMIDFRPWKIGNNMIGDKQSEVKFYLKYRNMETGETKEYLSPNYPWNDSIWMNTWEFVDQRIESDAKQIAHNLRAEDENGNDFTSYVLESNTIFVMVVYDLDEANKKALSKAAELEKLLVESGFSVVLLTSSLPETATDFQNEYDTNFEVLFADATVLKTMIRSNPGLVLFHKGVVAGKWHYNDFPNIADIQSIVNKLD